MTLRDSYETLKTERIEFEERAHRSAVLTIPSVQPRDGQLRHMLPQNFQSIGSRGVNNMTAKLMLTLFPTTLPFMRLEINPSDLEVLAESPQAKSEIEASLLKIEQQAASDFDTNGWRPAVSEAMRLLVVTGNALIFDRPEGRAATYDLRRYAVERDPEGTVLQVILKQAIGKEAAMAQLEGKVDQAEIEGMMSTTVSFGNKPSLELYTGARLLPSGKYAYWQEINGIVIGDVQELPQDRLPLIPLRFQPIYGYSYGRGYVEEYDGDLLVLESISRALAEGSLALAKILWLVKPGGTTKPQVLAKAPNGAIRQGDGEDVSTLQAEKGSDLAVAFQMRSVISVSLSNAFLLNSSVQRQGERVTAEEIRFVAQELEDALGGVYASLADTVQRPIVEYIFRKMQVSGDVVKLPKAVQPKLATGLEAISRNHTYSRITQFVSALQQLLGPDQMLGIIRAQEVAADLATSLNLDKSRYILSEEEIAARQQEQQAQQAVEALGPDAIRAASQQPQQ